MAAKRVPADVRRRHLVETALVIAEREGPAAVTARRVAAGAHVSLGLVHYCFENTQELFRQMAERMVEQLGEVALPALAAPASGADVRAFLDMALAALWREIEVTAGRQLLTYEMTTYAVRTRGLEAIAQRQYEVADQVASELLQNLAQLADVSWSAEVGELARLVVMAVDGATLRWLTDRDSSRALTSLSFVADLIAAAARPGGPVPDRAHPERRTMHSR